MVAITNSRNYAVESKFVKKTFEHLFDIKRRETIRANQRKLNQHIKKEMKKAMRVITGGTNCKRRLKNTECK